MPPWIVVEYDAVDVRRMQDAEPHSVPGSPVAASVVQHVPDGATAIKRVAHGHGFFAAFPLPDVTPVEVSLEIQT